MRHDLPIEELDLSGAHELVGFVGHEGVELDEEVELGEVVAGLIGRGSGWDNAQVVGDSVGGELKGTVERPSLIGAWS